MLAAVHDRYGSPDALRVEERPGPTPKPGEVLIAVRASSINSWDWDNLRGTPLARVFSPRRPPTLVPGIDVAGVVESVGDGVTDLSSGDEVYGDLSASGFGAMAEYVTARATMVTAKPPSLTFEEAASLPHAGVLAQQAFDKAGVKAGQRLLVNGAGGGVGPLLIQLAKHRGVEVVAVDRPEKFDMMRQWGADKVIDFQTEKFYKTAQPSNAVIDVISRQSLRAARKALKPGGRYVVVGGTFRSLIQLGVIGPLTSRFGDKHVGILAHKPGREALEKLTGLVVSGVVRPIVDKVYPLSHVTEAFRYFGSGLHRGKVVITID